MDDANANDRGALPLEGTPPAADAVAEHGPSAERKPAKEKSSGSAKPTPMMAQFIEIKAANPDCLLFYRMGDFYELFFDDAEIAARALGIALTKRGQHDGRDVPMAGVPVHAADDYLQKLIRLGHRVAVCEQTEDPAEAKKRGSKAIVRRDVVRLVTPGTITEERLLEPGRGNALAAVARIRTGDETADWAIATVDISTGTFAVTTTSQADVLTDLARLAPSEVVVPETMLGDDWTLAVEVALVGHPAADAGRARERLSEHFAVATLDGFGQFSRAELAAAALALAYVKKTQLAATPRLAPPVREDRDGVLHVDAATRANLELTRTLSGERVGSLLHAIDRTVSPGGARCLAERLASPLTDAAAIGSRLDAVGSLVHESGTREKLREILKGLADMPRALSRLALERGGPRDLRAIQAGLAAAMKLRTTIASAHVSEELEREREAMQNMPPGLAEHLAEALADDLPLLARDGGFTRKGFREDLDEVRRLSSDTRKVVAGLQSKYVEATACRGLKIKHNNVLGYFIEVPAAQAAPLQRDRETFIHRQTMANAMRFSTPELAELESKIADASGRALAIETEVFAALRADVLKHADRIAQTADAAARVDVAAAFAELAEEQGYCRPVVDESRAFEIVAGRHPVVEPMLRRAAEPPFVANDCCLGTEECGLLWLLTGPNMGGKSTFLRQNALIALMAQTGSFVPAGAARIGVLDRLFSRVGAADDLARGRSTFMVEMVETAAILNQATDRSLVILDELGRGTSTFDGLSIAWGTIEHLHERNRCRTLFATHYHELTTLAANLERATNVTMRVKEWEGDVVFLHEVVSGTSDRSYGIQVAKLAGLPAAVIARAKDVLAQLEGTAAKNPAQALVDDLPLFAAQPLPEKKDGLREALADVNPDELSPREAHELVYRLKREAR